MIVYEKLDKKDTCLDTTIFKEADKQIIDNLNEQSESSVEEIWGKDGWYLKQKKESELISKLISAKKQFDRLDITLNKVLIIISAINIYTNLNVTEKTKTFIRVPDRLLCDRGECSRAKLLQILMILHKLHILSLDIRGTHPKIRLDYTLLDKDPYYNYKMKRLDETTKKDFEVLNTIRKRYDTDFYYGLSYCTYRKKINSAIIGITLAYNDLLTGGSQKFHKHRLIEAYENNPELNMLYVEVPVHWIASILKISEEQVMKHLYELCKHTDYISKHSLVYSDIKLNPMERIIDDGIKIDTTEHYYNEEYRNYAKNVYYKMNNKNGDSYELGHPRVTPFSYIIYLDKLQKRRIGKEIIKNYMSYYNALMLNMYLDGTNNLTYRDDINIPLAEKRTGNKSVKVKSDIAFDKDAQSYREVITTLFDGSKQQGSVITSYGLFRQKYYSTMEGYVPRMKIPDNISSMSSSRLVKILGCIVHKVVDCQNKDLTFYIRKFKAIEDILSSRLFQSFSIVRNMDRQNKRDMKQIDQFKINLSKTLQAMMDNDMTYNTTFLDYFVNKLKSKIAKTEWFKERYLDNYMLYDTYELDPRTQSKDSIINVFLSKAVNVINLIQDGKKLQKPDKIEYDAEDWTHWEIL